MRIGTHPLRGSLFLAPMAGISDRAFRIITRNFGASLCYTEMVSAEGLIRSGHRSFEYLRSSRSDTPLAVQLFGSNPDSLAEAARIVEDKGADLIDINMGCPVKKVIRNGAGAALMKDPLRLIKIVKSIRKATTKPFTIKVRSGWNASTINVVEIACMAEDEGVDSITVHPRTAVQGFRGEADWNLIAQVKDVLSIPVIGSGDLWTPGDIQKMREHTRCDAVMIARGSLGNPWIFRTDSDEVSARSPSTSPSALEREHTIRLHLELSLELYGPKVGLFNFRKHLLWYTKGLPGGARFRKAVVEEKNVKSILESLHRFLHSTDHDQLQGERTDHT